MKQRLNHKRPLPNESPYLKQFKLFALSKLDFDWFWSHVKENWKKDKITEKSGRLAVGGVISVRVRADVWHLRDKFFATGRQLLLGCRSMDHEIGQIKSWMLLRFVFQLKLFVFCFQSTQCPLSVFLLDCYVRSLPSGDTTAAITLLSSFHWGNIRKTVLCALLQWFSGPRGWQKENKHALSLVVGSRKCPATGLRPGYWVGSEDKSVSDVELPQQCLIKEYSRLQAMSQLELEAGAVWRFFSPLSRHRADTNWRRNLKLNMF